MKKDMKKWFHAAILGLAIAIQAGFCAFGADGTWIRENDTWTYVRPDGGKAQGTWEDIDGEWYHFGSDGAMQTGWHKIGNQWYCFEDTGALAEGWRSMDDGDGKKWYYFDANGTAATRWKQIDGNWYWFLPSGAMNTETSRNIDGRRYYFREDGSLRTNEYEKFRYLNYDGLPDSAYNVKAENIKGKKITADESDQELIAEKLNALPAGWRKKFIDDNWHLVYCPEKEYYGSVKYEDSEELYYVKHKLSTSAQTIYFSDPEAIWTAFGEYMYREVKRDLKSENYSATVDALINEIIGIENIPESYYKNYQKIFGLLFSEYMDKEKRETMQYEMKELSHIVEKIINSRKADGTIMTEE